MARQVPAGRPAISDDNPVSLEVIVPFIPVLPEFNLDGTYYDDVQEVDTPFQLYLATKGILDIQPAAPNFWVPPIYLRLPKAFRLVAARPWVGGFFYFTSGLGEEWYYRVRWWEFAHKGFANEYIQMLAEQCDEDGFRPDVGR